AITGEASESMPLGSPPHASEASGGEGLGVGGALQSDTLDPPPGSVLRTSPPSPPLVQVGCFRLGPIMKWPNPGTPGFGGGRVAALTVRDSISRIVHMPSPAGEKEHVPSASHESNRREMNPASRPFAP